jgi:gamma-glutamyltranspeptidase/glutathione hydrolase
MRSTRAKPERDLIGKSGDALMFTTRPEIKGTFGVAASTHWIASSVGFGILERGGNAFDAAVAMGFVLQVVEPHLCGPAGEVPILLRPSASGEVKVLCGQGVTPAAATLEAYSTLGLDLVPGSGLLATVVPGAFDAWMLLLRDHGTLPLAEVLEPAIHYADAGHPVLPRVAATIAELAGFFRDEWPSSAATWLPGGNAPAPYSLFRNPALAASWRRVIAETHAKGHSREAEIEAARDVFYRGFVADAIDRFCRETEAMDTSGRRHRGLLTGSDLAHWQASYEAPLTYDYQGWRVNKTGPWGQGPVFLQVLALLAETDLAALPPAGSEFAHTLVEAMKLAFADREAYYGDPDFTNVPIKQLLSDSYNAERRKLLGARASRELRPGIIEGYEDQVRRALAALPAATEGHAPGAGEPTMAHLSERRGDTVHLDVIDRWGNMVSATPSGGWLQSSPVIPELGFPLNSRAQMFWLKPDLPASMAPGRRPRTTLTPTLAIHADGRALVFGTPGGDQQEQWQLALFLRHVHHRLNLQEAIDMPLFHTAHFPASFYPRQSQPGHLMAEENFGECVLAELRARGHDVEVAPVWSVGRLTAAARDADGLLRAAATPRLMQAYAVGR